MRLLLAQLCQDHIGAQLVIGLNHQSARKCTDIAFHRRDVLIRDKALYASLCKQMLGIRKLHRIIRAEHFFHYWSWPRRFMSTERAS